MVITVEISTSEAFIAILRRRYEHFGNTLTHDELIENAVGDAVAHQLRQETRYQQEKIKREKAGR